MTNSDPYRFTRRVDVDRCVRDSKTLPAAFNAMMAAHGLGFYSRVDLDRLQVEAMRVRGAWARLKGGMMSVKHADECLWDIEYTNSKMRGRQYTNENAKTIEEAEQKLRRRLIENGWGDCMVWEIAPRQKITSDKL